MDKMKKGFLEIKPKDKLEIAELKIHIIHLEHRIETLEYYLLGHESSNQSKSSIMRRIRRLINAKSEEKKISYTL